MQQVIDVQNPQKKLNKHFELKIARAVCYIVKVLRLF